MLPVKYFLHRWKNIPVHFCQSLENSCIMRIKHFVVISLCVYYVLDLSYSLRNTYMESKNFKILNKHKIDAMTFATVLNNRVRRHGYEEEDDHGGYEVVCKHSNTGN